MIVTVKGYLAADAEGGAGVKSFEYAKELNEPEVWGCERSSQGRGRRSSVGGSRLLRMIQAILGHFVLFRGGIVS